VILCCSRPDTLRYPKGTFLNSWEAGRHRGWYGLKSKKGNRDTLFALVALEQIPFSLPVQSFQCPVPARHFSAVCGARRRLLKGLTLRRLRRDTRLLKIMRLLKGLPEDYRDHNGDCRRATEEELPPRRLQEGTTEQTTETTAGILQEGTTGQTGTNPAVHRVVGRKHH
jgi:hypothetical protein